MKRTMMMVLTAVVLCGCATGTGRQVAVVPTPDGAGGAVVVRGVWGRAADVAADRPVLTAATVAAVAYGVYQAGEHYGWWDELTDDGDEDGGNRDAPPPPPQAGDEGVQVYVSDSSDVQIKVNYKTTAGAQ